MSEQDTLGTFRTSYKELAAPPEREEFETPEDYQRRLRETQGREFTLVLSRCSLEKYSFADSSFTIRLNIGDESGDRLRPYRMGSGPGNDPNALHKFKTRFADPDRPGQYIAAPRYRYSKHLGVFVASNVWGDPTRELNPHLNDWNERLACIGDEIDPVHLRLHVTDLSAAKAIREESETGILMLNCRMLDYTRDIEDWEPEKLVKRRTGYEAAGLATKWDLVEVRIMEIFFLCGARQISLPLEIALPLKSR